MKTPKPEDVFNSRIKLLITNLIINNPNYENDYYYNKKDHVWRFEGDRLIQDTKERGNYIIDEIDKMWHLIEFSKGETA